MRGPVGSEHAEPGCHHRHADGAVELVVEGRADDDIGVRIGFGADALGSLVNLVEGEVVAAGDGNEQPARALPSP